MIGRKNRAKMLVEEVVDELEHGDCWLVPGDDTEEIFEHLAKGLYQDL